jgi:putative nucleotidyltransferase with HDIG domain
MQQRRVQVYVGLMTLLAGGSLAVQDWSLFQVLDLKDLTGFASLLVLGVLAESRTLSITVAKKPGSTSSIGFIPLLACVLLFGPVLTLLYIAVTGAIGEFLIRKKEALKAVFNTSQYVVSASVAGLLFLTLGGQPLIDHLRVLQEVYAGRQLLAFLGFGSSFLILNHAAVSLAIALSEGLSPRKVWVRLVGKTGTNLGYDILISPIAFAVAYLYLELWIWGLVLSVLPLLFVRHAYQTILQLQKANRDLLTALVKAIETRDPYTSGHSLRVASLALRIADSLGLSPKSQRDVEQAAMLHDIGKIEAIYSEILQKGDSLTHEERQIIQSHVMKGVELLEQMSSFSKEAIAGVRGHHERVDGKGYPDGLVGEEIPLSARIIKVCDAVDAMLSDRPYRKALKIPAVREQLVEYAGSQFDPEIVDVILRDSLLEKHAAEVAFLRGEDERIPETAATSEVRDGRRSREKVKYGRRGLEASEA